ncbi:MAG: (cytosine-5)-methyltransferase 1 [Cryptosporangiaceae bacterium]|nr:(cytosine-5)-methyltransferase 1 [Cryptosporangiaceae bacterium]
MSELNAVEICAGAGGQALGLELAGFGHALAVELDSNAANTLVANRPQWRVAVGDVADPQVWCPDDYAGVDLLAGGVPCPPFSFAGKQLGATDERDLFAWAVELAGRIRPRALLLENVRGLSAPRFAAYRQHVAERLAELGYWSQWRLLHASDFGVPQLRPRFVLVALDPEDARWFRWPDPRPLTETVGSTLAGLMAANGWPGAPRWASGAAGVAPTVVGGSKKHGGADLGPTRAKRAWAALGVDGLGIADEAPDRTTPSGYTPRLTCEMVQRIQGWHDDPQYAWHFTGRKTSRYRQIGNAFPPPVARAVGESIRIALRREGLASGAEIGAVHHDRVYSALRAIAGFATAEEIGARSGESGLVVRARLRHLARDFVIDEKDTEDGPAYRIGEFRAFTGQEVHERHARFADGRASIS